MYRAFYGLKALPFRIDTDPAFLWLGEKHREAISMLKYGIQGDGHTGILLLTGDVGTGKTTLVNALFNSLDKRVIRVAITNPNLDGLDFLNYIAAAYGSKKEFTSKSQFLIHFTRFLKNAGAKGRKVLLVVDEAQLLSHTLLEEIRLFSNIEHQGKSLIHTFLVGQHELREKLSRPENRALKQRISLNYNIDALVFEETDEYIKYRLQVAGVGEKLFNPDAVQLIHRFALGLPRTINIICDHAMLTGYVQNLKTIGAQIIQECIKELSIPIVQNQYPLHQYPLHQYPMDQQPSDQQPVNAFAQPDQYPPPPPSTAQNPAQDYRPSAPHPPQAREESRRYGKPLMFGIIGLSMVIALLTAFIFFF